MQTCAQNMNECPFSDIFVCTHKYVEELVKLNQLRVEFTFCKDHN